ncbi:caspase family protein, partial [Nostoc sp. NIES-2111]
GENYLVPVGAQIERVSDIPIEAFRLSDLTRSLEGLQADLRIVMLDAGRPFPPTQDNQPLARGLALVDPPQGFAVSFSTAPGEVAEDGQGPYGPYATAFVEMIRQPGLSLPDLFGRIRVRVHELTQGAQTPWDVVKSDTPFVFLAPQEGAAVPPQPPPPPQDFASVGDREAYGIALERDTIPAYQDFLRAYPDSTFAPRVKRLLAQRREALTWQRTVARDTPDAYWTYLKRYPRGLHAAD